jgi:hypothetical protein
MVAIKNILYESEHESEFRNFEKKTNSDGLKNCHQNIKYI